MDAQSTSKVRNMKQISNNVGNENNIAICGICVTVYAGMNEATELEWFR